MSSTKNSYASCEEWKKSKQSEKASASGKNNNGYDSYEEWKMRTRGDEVIKDISTRFDSWWSDYDSLAKEYSSRYTNVDTSVYRSDSADWLSNISSRVESNKQAALEIKDIVEQYKDYLDADWVQSFYDAIYTADRYKRDMVSGAEKESKYWSQWDGEDAYYNDYFGSKYAGKTYTEVLEAYKRTDGKERDWLYDNLDNFKSSAELQAEIDDINKAYNLDAPYLEQALKHSFEDLYDLLDSGVDEGTREWARDEVARLKKLKADAKKREEKQEFFNDFLAPEVHPDIEIPDFNEYIKKGKDEGVKEDNHWTGPLSYEYGYASDIIAVKEGKIMASGDGFYQKFINSMDDDQYNNYAYLFGKYGKKVADKYLHHIESEVTVEEGKRLKEAFDTPFIEDLFHITANIERLAGDMKSIFSDGYKEMSAIQIADQMLGADKKGLEKVAWDLEGNIAYMMPSMLAGHVTSAFLGPAGLGVMSAKTAGAVGQAGLTGLSSYGAGRQEMLNLGYNESQANAYGLLSGVSEAGLQYFLNGVGKFGGIGTEAAVKSFASGLNSAAAKFAIEFAVDMGGEFTEEWLQEVLTPFFKKIATGKHEDVDWGQAAYAGMLGALSAGVINGARAGKNRVSNLFTARDIKKDGKVDALKNIGTNMFAADTLAHKLASKVDNTTSAWKLATLINEMNGFLSEQNKADIKHELIRNGVLESDAESIAEWLGKAVDGEYFTPAQRKALDSNPVITEVFKNIILDQNSSVNKRLNALSDIYGKPGHWGVDLYAISEAQTKEGLSDSINIRNILNEISKETIKQQYGIGRSKSYNDMIAAKVDEAKAAMNNIDIPVVENEEQNESKKEAFSAKTSKTMAVSSDGVTRLTATGEAAEISDVVSVKNGEVQVKLTNGQTVSAQELSFSTDYEAAIYEQIASFEFPPSIMKNIATKYDPSSDISPAEYLKAAAIAYTYGKYNIPQREIPAGLSDAQKNYIYKLGQTFTENRVKQDEEKIKAAQQNDEISEDMPETERAEILKRKTITIRSLNADNALGIDETQLKKNMKSMVEKPLLRKLREMGCFRSYKTDSVDVEFEFTGMNMRKSMNSQVSDYGGTLNDLAKIVTNMQEILDDAVLIEIHSDKAKGTKKENARLVKTYVLLSAFSDNNSIVPVQFEIKHFVDNQNRLYLVAALTKIETGVMGDTVHQNDERTRLLPVSKISIPSLIAKVNPDDANFFKYIPDEMLDAQQLRAKKHALSKEAEKYGRTFVDPTVNSDDAQNTAKNTGELVIEKGANAVHKSQKIALRVLKLLANRLGLTIHVYKSDMVDGERVYTRADGTVVSGKNGWYDTKTGEIWLDINAGTTGQGLILFTASHELVHFIRQWSPAKFKILADFLMDKYGEAGKSVDDLIHQQMSSRGIKYGEAYEEVVASSMEAMLKDGKVLEKLAELEKKDHGIVQKIRTFLKNFADKLRAAYKDIDPATEEGQFFAEMTEEADRIAQMFAEALHDAGENFKKTDVSKFETSEGVKYSETTYANKGFAEYEAQTALYDALDHADRGDENLISVGQMPEYITNLIGIEGEFYIYRNHAYENMVSKEQAMQDGRYNSKAHYHNLGIETMTDAMMSLSDPIMTISTKSKEGNPTVIMLLPVQGKNNAPLYAVLSFYSNKPINGSYSEKPHIVLTIAERDFFNDGGRAGINEVIKSAIEDGRVLDFDPKKRDALSVIAKTTRLGNITESSLKNSIAQFRKTVKSFKEKHKILYSSSSTDVSTRGLLVNALESAAQTDGERKKLSQYKAKISEIEALEQRIDELVEEKRKLRADKENADAIKLREIQDEIIKTTNRIDIADKQLLRLEVAKELQNIVERQRSAAYAKAKEVAKQHRKEADERREKTLRRNQIRKTVDDLNRLLTRPTKEKHVPIWLQKPVAEFLSAIDQDNDSKIAYYDAKVKKFSEELEALQANPQADPAVIQEVKLRLANAQARGFKTVEHLRAIKAAYDKIFESKDPVISNAFHPEVSEKLEEIVSMIGQNVPLSTMSLPELDQVFQAVKIVENVVRNANKFFAEGQKQTITETAKAIDNEVLRNRQKIKERIKAVEEIKGLTFTNNLKPLTLAKMIGSDTFTALLERMIDSENTWAVDQWQAKQYYEKIVTETGAKSWELEARREVTLGGEKVSLSLGQIMSLYALSRRKQAVKHLTEGGFVDGEDQVFYKRHKLKVLELEVNALRPTRITAKELADIGKLLTDKQVEFVREMQSYLSTTMANKGNESSRAMYGIDLFGEPFYFPIKSKQSFLAEEKRNADGKNRTKNLGMTKQTTPGANNPVVLSDFMNVWTKHINDMALYHSVTTIEDFSRVWNSRYAELDGGTPKTLKDTVTTVCGKNVSKYVDKLIDDANAGIRSQDRSFAGIEKLTSRTKKAAVYLSASVTIQQISAIDRAKAYIPERYFLKSIFEQFKKGHKASWEEMKRYCPVAIIKEMGGYDLTGANTRQWMMGAKGTVAKIDDKLGNFPALMDELAWCAIWEAGKNMTASLRGEHGEVLYEKGSEAFYKKSSEIVTEAIRHTQVYDSIFVRSGHMRSNSQYAKALTAFMAEPTTSFNMYIEAMIDFKRGGEIRTAGRKVKAKIFAIQLATCVVRASIGAALTAALIHAMRDDDEEKTFAEKYAGHAVVDVIDNLTVFNMIPIVKDYFSITQGYDIARPDVQLFEDAWRAYNALDSGELSSGEKIIDIVATISSFTPIPLKNLKRDAVGLYNTLFNSVPLSKTTWLGVKEAVSEEISGKEESNSDLLYEAMLGGSKKEIGRIKARFNGDSQIQSAIRKGLRENDPRIKEAAMLNIKGDMKGYAEIVNEIASEKIFEKDRIIEAVNLEINAINRENKVADNEPIDEDETVTSLFNASMLNRTLDGGDTETALEMIDDMVNAKVKSGKTEQEAKSAIKSNVTRYWKEKYIAAWRAGDDEEMVRIRKLLTETNLYGGAYKVSTTVRDWLKEAAGK